MMYTYINDTIKYDYIALYICRKCLWNTFHGYLFTLNLFVVCNAINKVINVHHGLKKHDYCTRYALMQYYTCKECCAFLTL